ncbi:hypothetical protein [Methylobacterium sp. ID0610]|uniref:hypothetical protein n=1 Tax=Methylobacterium carpenticola TaxID=3344827 RepID=UPI0036B335C8
MTRCTRTGVARALLCAALLGPAAAPGLPTLVAPALAQDGTVALDDLSFRFGATLVKVPRLELRGTALSRADLQAILDPASAEPWPARLRRLSAESLAIPLLRVEQALGDTVQVVVYRDLVARSLTEGRIGSLDVAGAVLTVEGGGKGDGRSGGANAGAGAYGRMAARDLDLTGLARLLTEAGGPEAPNVRVYGSIAIDDIAVSGPRGEAFRIGHLEGRDFGGRPTAMPWGEAANRLSAGDPAKASPEERARVMALAADLLDAVSVGPVELRDLSVMDPGEGAPTRFTLARLAFGPDGGAGMVRTEALALDGPELRFGLKTLTLSGLSLKPTLAGLRRSAAGPLDPAEMRRYAPLIGRVALDGLEVDVPPAKDPGKPLAKDPLKAEAPVHVALRSASLDMSAPRDGIPTAARLNLDGLAFPVSASDPSLAALAGLGYTAVDLSGVLDSSWNEETREVSVREFSLTGKDMGRARLTATLGGVGSELFNPDVAVSSLALLGATAKALALTVENSGLFERFVADQAKAQSLKPAELQQEYSAAALLGIPAVLGNSTGAKALGQAVSRFVTKPGRLTVTAAAKDPGGLGFLDVSTAASPGKVFERLNVTATAE